MIRSLFTSSSGLRGHQQYLDTVGNNLANVNTYGFKAQRLRFSTLFAETLRGATPPRDELGGTNPKQIGHGVKVAAIDTIFRQGGTELTGNSLDSAILGNGFYVLDTGNGLVYSRAGAFSVDANNTLVDSATGFKVQRFGTVGAVATSTAPVFQDQGNNINLPFGATIPGRETSTIDFAGNLNASSDASVATVLSSSQPLTIATVAAQGVTPLSLLDQTTSPPYMTGDEILISGTRPDGAAVSGTFRFGIGNEVQTLNLSGATGGQFHLTFNGETTAAINFDATMGDVQTALNSLSSIMAAGSVSVSGGPVNQSAVEITFNGGMDVAELVANHAGTLVGANVSSAVTTTVDGDRNEVQQMNIVGATSGQFTLTFNAATTGDLGFNATASAVQTALEGLATIGAGNVQVTGGPANNTPLQFEFTGALAGTNVAQLVAANGTAALVGATAAGSISTTTQDDEQQQINLVGATGGKFSISFGGQTTTDLDFDAAATDVQTALEALTTVGAGNVTVTGGPTNIGVLNVAFTGTLASTNVGQMTVNNGSQTIAGATVTSAVTTTNEENLNTVNSLLATINRVFSSGSSGIGATASINTSGNIVLTADANGTSTPALTLASNTTDTSPTTGLTTFSNFAQTTAGATGATAVTSITVYDTQGAPHLLSFTFTKQAANLWDLEASIASTDGTITGFGRDNLVQGISFNEDGSIASITGNSTAQTLVSSTRFATPAPAGAAATGITVFSPATLAQNTVEYAATDVIELRGTDFDGSTVSVDFTTTAGGALMLEDLRAAIDAAYSGASAAIDANGHIVLTADTTGQGNLTLTLADAAGNTGQTAFGTLGQTIAGTDGDSNITLEINNLANFGTTQSLTLDLGAANSFLGLTQFGGFENVSATSQDGFAPGSLTSVDIDANGIIQGAFDNGRTEPLAQFAIAMFINDQGLTRVQDTAFRVSPNSGPATIGAANTGGRGTISGGTLETSNVDIATEFTRLITAQRGYQVNARGFVTSDEVLEETVNLKR